MSDTTTLDDTDEQLPELVESEYIGAEAPSEDTPLKMRLLLPIMIPIVSLAIVAVLVLNISRVFLAGDKDAALVVGIVITLSILIGASLLAAAPRMKSSSLALVLGGMFVVVVLAGLVSLGPSLDTGEGTAVSVYSTKPATGSADVEALASIKFNSTAFSAKLSLIHI